MPEVRPNVTLIRYTPAPEELVALAGKLCYSPATLEDLAEGVADHITVIEQRTGRQMVRRPVRNRVASAAPAKIAVAGHLVHAVIAIHGNLLKATPHKSGVTLIHLLSYAYIVSYAAASCKRKYTPPGDRKHVSGTSCEIHRRIAKVCFKRLTETDKIIYNK